MEEKELADHSVAEGPNNKGWNYVYLQNMQDLKRGLAQQSLALTAKASLRHYNINSISWLAMDGIAGTSGT